MLPNGTKRLSGFVLLVIPVVANWFGYDVAEAFPVEAARFSDDFFVVVGGIVMLVGVLKAKGPMWFIRK